MEERASGYDQSRGADGESGLLLGCPRSGQWTRNEVNIAPGAVSEGIVTDLFACRPALPGICEAVGGAGVGEKVLEPPEFVDLQRSDNELYESKVGRKNDAPNYKAFDSIVPIRRVLGDLGGEEFG